MTGAGPTQRLRLFVAIELPDDWKQGLDELQTRLRTALARDTVTAGASLRWVQPDALHLTLKFIGETEPERLQPISEQLQYALIGAARFTLALDTVGSFQGRRVPRVIWAGMQARPPDALPALAERIDASLAIAGIPPENRPFQAHLTLARLPDGLTDEQRRRAVGLAGGLPLPALAPLHVRDVSLIQSHLGPAGPRYERLQTWQI